jgi:hypothetical protein
MKHHLIILLLLPSTPGVEKNSTLYCSNTADDDLMNFKGPIPFPVSHTNGTGMLSPFVK